MLQPRRRFDLAAKPPLGHRIERARQRDHLQRHLAPRIDLPRPPHRPHAAAPENLQQLMPADLPRRRLLLPAQQSRHQTPRAQSIRRPRGNSRPARRTTRRDHSVGTFRRVHDKDNANPAAGCQHIFVSAQNVAALSRPWEHSAASETEAVFDSPAGEIAFLTAYPGRGPVITNYGMEPQLHPSRAREWPAAWFINGGSNPPLPATPRAPASTAQQLLPCAAKRLPQPGQHFHSRIRRPPLDPLHVVTVHLRQSQPLGTRSRVSDKNRHRLGPDTHYRLN